MDDGADGSITLRDAADDILVATVQPGSDNFVRATLLGTTPGSPVAEAMHGSEVVEVG